VLLGVAACFLALVWLMWIAGDPTDGLAFYTLAFTSPVLIGVALVIAAHRRRDIFGTLGLWGAIGVLVAGLGFGVVGFAAGVLGLGALAVAVARSDRRLLFGVVLIGVGAFGLLVRADAYAVVLPLVVLGSAVLALTLRRVST
jgi:hypothetical protein